MNPVLLKPGSDRRSHVVVMGRPGGHARRAGLRGRAHRTCATRRTPPSTTWPRATTSSSWRARAARRRSTCAPATTSTWAWPGTARSRRWWSATSTAAGSSRRSSARSPCSTPADQALVAGFVVNKFRGDLDLLRPGLDELRGADRPARCTACCRGTRTSGSTPRTRSTCAGRRRRRRGGAAAGSRSSGCRGSPTSPTSTRSASSPASTSSSPPSPRALAGADLVVLPGTRATLADLAWLRARGLDRRRPRARRGRQAGARHLRRLPDARARDRRPRRRRGRGRCRRRRVSGCSTSRTTFGADKVLRLPTGEALGAPAHGYEIHHGRITRHGGEEFLGGARRGAVFGTMWHGSLEGDELRRALLRRWPRRRSVVRAGRRELRRARERAARPARRPGRGAPRRRRAARPGHVRCACGPARRCSRGPSR